MTLCSQRVIITLLFAACATQALAFNVVECLSQNTKAECTRQMLIEEELSKPLAAGEEIKATSGKYAITIQGEGWLRNGWGSRPEKTKDLGIIKDSGVGLLDFELSTVTQADFESTITQDMKGIYQGLQEGFKKGKITISTRSQMEILPLTIAGGSGMLGRFCYRIELDKGQSVCVYEGYIGNDTGESIKLLGSIGDYDNMRAELESIVTSFKFTE